jgi:two-component system LytT family sensor kinase
MTSMKIFKRKDIPVLVHILCWVIFAFGVLYYHPLSWGVTLPREFWIKQTILLFLLLFVFYVNLFILIPRFLFNGKVVIYTIVAIMLIFAVTLLSDYLNTIFDLNEVIIKRPHSPKQGLGRGQGHHGSFNTFVSGLNLLMIGLGITISFIQKWQQEVNLREQLEKEKVTTELTLLKAQINPHFFFNTLNTIYSYTLSDGDVARTAITNLSKMMRYVLYDASGKQTTLSKEIDFIREYIELMKLRISDKTTVVSLIQESSGDLMIAPMIFLPFIENAFKHGVSGIADGHITIGIMQSGRSVELIVKNTVYENRRASEDESNGIGMANTTRRLELLYAGNYSLSTGLVNKSEYEVKLKITL